MNKISVLSEGYREVAKRGRLLFFFMNDLHKINPLYTYSLNTFVANFQARHSAKGNDIFIGAGEIRVGAYLTTNSSSMIRLMIPADYTGI